MVNSWRETRITQALDLRWPIIQGPFGGGLSSIDLVVEVANAGGLGSFGANGLGGAEIVQLAQNLRSRTNKPFALNLWIPHEGEEGLSLADDEFQRALAPLKPYFDELNLALPKRPPRFAPNYSDQVEAVLEARPAVFSFVFGIPSERVLERCRELQIIIIGTATTVDEAIALDRAGVDMIVATGFEAGGHRVSFLRPAEESLMGTFALVPQVVDSVRAPVIAAGGIADGRGIAAAYLLGAQAVQIGTAFLACSSSGASPAHREQLQSERAKYTTLTTAFTGRLARGIDNEITARHRQERFHTAPYPAQRWITAQLRAAALEQQRHELLPFWCGQAAPLLRYRSAADLMAALVAQTDALLTR